MRSYSETSQYKLHSLDSLSNLPTVQSIYYPIKPFKSGNLSKPFNYKTGVYPGQYGRVIGRGGEGTVIEGIWGNEKCAYKFVEIKNQKQKDTVGDNLKDMNTRLKEMIEMEKIGGSNVLKLEGYYR